MPAKPDQRTTEAAARRKGAVRTALIVAAIAVAIYVGFILLGVVGQ
jgi:hypothetical protein